MEGTSGGGMADFNVHHGFIEGIVRGFKSGFITDNVSEGGGVKLEINNCFFCLSAFMLFAICT